MSGRTDIRFYLTVAEAALVLPLVAAMLRLFGFNRTKNLLRLDGDTDLQQPGELPAPVRSSAAAVATVVRASPIRTTCLPKALTVSYLARRRGYDTVIVIGVATGSTAGLRAHAWVEFGGMPVNEAADVRERYDVLQATPPLRADGV